MKTFRKSLWALPLIGLFSLTVHGQDFKLNDIKAQNGVLLTADDLKKLLPGAKVTSYTRAGSTRFWTNEVDGKFVASSDSRGTSPGGRSASTSAPGTWSISPAGAYCVTLDWRTTPEQWCRHIFKAGDKFYAVRTLKDGATEAHRIEFRGG